LHRSHKRDIKPSKAKRATRTTTAARFFVTVRPSASYKLNRRSGQLNAFCAALARKILGVCLDVAGALTQILAQFCVRGQEGREQKAASKRRRRLDSILQGKTPLAPLQGKTPLAPPRNAPPLLRVVGLKKTYATPQGPLAILKGVDFSLDAGSSTALMGESGSGKSTFLHLIAGLDEADEGEIWSNGVLVTGLSDFDRAALRRKALGVVFQQFNLIPSLTVADNLAFQARIAGRFDPAWQHELSARLRLENLAGRYPEQLSGGQQQRVAIGRALAVRPRLLLADEPTGNLDEVSGDEVLALALDLVALTGCAFLMVTHSARLAAKLERQVRLIHGVMAPP
jgi:putative ABC transport system ATP-binding protein